MVQHEITLPVDVRGRPTLPNNAATLPIVPLMEALITAGCSDQQVRQALQVIISHQEVEDDDLSGKVVEFVRHMTFGPDRRHRL